MPPPLPADEGFKQTVDTECLARELSKMCIGPHGYCNNWHTDPSNMFHTLGTVFVFSAGNHALTSVLGASSVQDPGCRP
jgi:hypothetical protein